MDGAGCGPDRSADAGDRAACPAPRDDNLLAVRYRRGEIDQLELRLARRPAGTRERIGHPATARETIETGTPDGADDIHIHQGSRGRLRPRCDRDRRRRGGLHGTVVISPSQPVCMVGEPCSKPDANDVLAFWRQGRRIATTRTDSAGHYRIALRPGRYTVTAPRHT